MLPRIGVLLCALLLAAASTTTQGRSPQYPSAPPPSYSSGAGVPEVPAEVAYACTEVHTAKTNGSFCFATQERCEDERRAAERDGARATECRPLAPVACFQLGNDPSPRMEACAETADDCDLLRLIDKEKNGQTGGPCAWRHGPAQNAAPAAPAAPPSTPTPPPAGTTAI